MITIRISIKCPNEFGKWKSVLFREFFCLADFIEEILPVDAQENFNIYSDLSSMWFISFNLYYVINIAKIIHNRFEIIVIINFTWAHNAWSFPQFMNKSFKGFFWRRPFYINHFNLRIKFVEKSLFKNYQIFSSIPSRLFKKC